MTKEQNYVKNFMLAAGQELPEKPVIPSEPTRRLRARLILEEALETIKGLGFMIAYANGEESASLDVEDKGLWNNVYFDSVYEPNLVEIADGCADIQVVTLGTTLACGIDQEPIDAEVNRSNMSKFVDGHKDPNTGKWIKGPSYSPANIAPIIEAQRK